MIQQNVSALSAEPRPMVAGTRARCFEFLQNQVLPSFPLARSTGRIVYGKVKRLFWSLRQHIVNPRSQWYPNTNHTAVNLFGSLAGVSFLRVVVLRPRTALVKKVVPFCRPEMTDALCDGHDLHQALQLLAEDSMVACRW